MGYAKKMPITNHEEFIIVISFEMKVALGALK
jgi:hypothetical protein